MEKTRIKQQNRTGPKTILVGVSRGPVPETPSPTCLEKRNELTLSIPDLELQPQNAYKTFQITIVATLNVS